MAKTKERREVVKPLSWAPTVGRKLKRIFKTSTLATWCDKPTHWKRPWCWERLKAKGDGGVRGMRWLDNTTDSVDMNMSKLQKTVKDRGAWHAAVHGVAKSWTWLSNWTTITALQCHATFYCATFWPAICIHISSPSWISLPLIRPI